MSQTEIRTITFVRIDCADCGIPFMVPEQYQTARRSDNASFKCPNGHGNVYRENQADKLRRQLQEKERDLEWERKNAAFWQEEYDLKKKALTATKGQLTKVKKRVSCGVCPCCNRSFQNLMHHMAHMHPGFAAEDVDVKTGHERLTVRGAIEKMGKGEFTTQELYDFFEQAGHKREANSLLSSLSSLKAVGTIEPVKGVAMAKVWRLRQ